MTALTALMVFSIVVGAYTVGWTVGHGAGWRARAQWMRCSQCLTTLYTDDDK